MEVALNGNLSKRVNLPRSPDEVVVAALACLEATIHGVDHRLPLLRCIRS